MNTWGYLILIAALLLIAALMLYARFASRSREKSLHHGPGQIRNVDETPEILVEDSTLSEDEWEEPVFEEAFTEEVTNEVEKEEEVILAVPTEEASEKKKEEEYFDELQEAAAGLAMLMRSSQLADRSEPVVFAPDGEELDSETVETSEETGAEVEAEESESSVLLSDQEESAAEAIHEIEAEISEEPVAEQQAVNEPSVSEGQIETAESESELVEAEEKEPVLSIVELLGEEVGDQIQRIDTGLDALEDLVASIEGSLAALAPLDTERKSLDDSAGENVSIEAAA